MMMYDMVLLSICGSLSPRSIFFCAIFFKRKSSLSGSNRLFLTILRPIRPPADCQYTHKIDIPCRNALRQPDRTPPGKCFYS